MEWNAYKYDIFSVSSNHLLRSYTSTYTSDNPGYMLTQLTSKNSENLSLHSSTIAALKEQSHSSSSAHLGSWGYITVTSPHTLGHIHKNLRRWRQRNRTQSKGLRMGVCVHVCKLGTASKAQSIVTDMPVAPIPLVCNTIKIVPFIISTTGLFRANKQWKVRDYKTLKVHTSKEVWCCTEERTTF